MKRPIRLIGAVAIGATAILTGCAGVPSRSGLVVKLKQENGLSTTQAQCVADGLYDGVPKKGSQAAIRRLSGKELRAVAKPDNAGKVSADVVQVMRDVVSACLPSNVQPVKP